MTRFLPTVNFPIAALVVIAVTISLVVWYVKTW